MLIIKTKDFNKALARLPAEVKKLYTVQEERFLLDSRDSRLHIKKLKELEGAFSFRITRNYRVLFYFQKSDTVILFEVDHRKDVYRNL